MNKNLNFTSVHIYYIVKIIQKKSRKVDDEEQLKKSFDPIHCSLSYFGAVPDGVTIDSVFASPGMVSPRPHSALRITQFLLFVSTDSTTSHREANCNTNSSGFYAQEVRGQQNVKYQ